jgi:hypothetical protein
MNTLSPMRISERSVATSSSPWMTQSRPTLTVPRAAVSGLYRKSMRAVISELGPTLTVPVGAGGVVERRRRVRTSHRSGGQSWRPISLGSSVSSSVCADGERDPRRTSHDPDQANRVVGPSLHEAGG